MLFFIFLWGGGVGRGLSELFILFCLYGFMTCFYFILFYLLLFLLIAHPKTVDWCFVTFLFYLFFNFFF